MSTQTLNLTPELYQYYREHAYREPSILAKLRKHTAEQFSDLAQMEISPEQGQFMQLLVTAIQAKKILEIGTFTGYSALWMALALPEKGHLLTCDIDAKATAVAQDFWDEAGLNQKIILKLAPASVTLQELLDEGQQHSFDFAFIDADKVSYDQYYEYCLKLLRPGGIISIDNTFQNGKVADLNNNNPNTIALRNLNEKLLKDDRISLSMLPLSDGLTLAYKK